MNIAPLRKWQEFLDTADQLYFTAVFKIPQSIESFLIGLKKK